MPARSGEVLTLDVDAYVTDERSWGLIRMAYAQILPTRLKEIEGSRRGHFFAKADASALKTPENGHFLRVICDAGGKKPARCDGKRDLLEARVMAATFLESAPRTHKPEELFDAATFELTPLGLAMMNKAEKKCPDLWQRLKVMTVGGVWPRR